MIRRKNRSPHSVPGVIFLLLLFSLPALFAGSTEVQDWSVPEKIDPFRKGILRFLDVNLSGYAGRAAECFRGGDYHQAAQMYLFILRHRYDSPAIIYSLACCYARLNRPELAVDCLLAAFKAGFREFERLSRDEALAPIRDSGRFKALQLEMSRVQEEFGERLYLTATKMLPARIHLPETYDPRQAYPLLIGLHGRGGSADGFATLWKFVKQKRFIFVVLEAPYALNDGLIRGPHSSWFFPTSDRDFWKRADPVTVEYIRRAAEEIRQAYKVTNTFLLAFSQGVAAGYLTVFEYPEQFAGMAAFAGMLPQRELLPEEKIRAAGGRVRVVIAHGVRDTAISLDTSRRAFQRLHDLGMQVELFVFSAGHTIPADPLNKALAWLMPDNQ